MKQLKRRRTQRIASGLVVYRLFKQLFRQSVECRKDAKSTSNSKRRYSKTMYILIISIEIFGLYRCKKNGSFDTSKPND